MTSSVTLPVPPPAAGAWPDPGVLSDPLGLLRAQLAGVDLWHAALRQARAAAAGTGGSRELRLDASRRLAVRLREREVLQERAAHALATRGPLRASTGPRAVVAHRHRWTRDALTRALTAAGVEVLMACDNGADALGASVAEQPHLLLVDAVLAMRSGAEVAQEAARLCPHTLVAGYVEDARAAGTLLDAGAATVSSRTVPPARAVEDLVALLRG